MLKLNAYVTKAFNIQNDKPINLSVTRVSQKIILLKPAKISNAIKCHTVY